MLDEEYNEVVKEAWEEGVCGETTMHTARLKLASCQTALIRWSGRKFGSAERNFKKKRKQLELLQREEGPDNRIEIKKL